jgi:branched-chain amino acid transport system substrate-binding protein
LALTTKTSRISAPISRANGTTPANYLNAIDAAGTDEAKAVIARMKATPINDFFAKKGHIREDGRMVHDMYLVQVKAPSESNGEWDLDKILDTIPGDQAYLPMAEGGCPLVKK